MEQGAVIGLWNPPLAKIFLAFAGGEVTQWKDLHQRPPARVGSPGQGGGTSAPNGYPGAEREVGQERL